MNVTELKVGQVARIVSIQGERGIRHRLLEMGVTPKSKIQLQKIAPLGDPIEIAIRSYSLSLRKEDAQWIEVEVEQ